MTTEQTAAHSPTDEQIDAMRLFGCGGNLAIEAGAGAGKTSTLVMLAEAAGRRRGQYAAFNKALVVESSAKFPGNVTCSTAHSLAFRAVGNRFAHRLRSARMRSIEIARILKIQPMIIRDTGNGAQKSLPQTKLAGIAMKAISNFCQSADPEPATRHIPYIDGIDMPVDGRKTYRNNNEVRESLIKPIRTAWKDLSDPNGVLTYSHGAYLKFWQLSKPTINADFILFDEAQDASPVMWDAILATARR
jgi:superfamily I DNA/RNA helicase